MKKMAALAIVALVAVAVSQPAMAGVGGCRVPGVGGCGNWQLTSVGSQPRTMTLLDSLQGALPADVLAMVKVLLQQKTSDQPTVIETPQSVTTAGVGGCFPRPGVGGCWL